MKIIAFILLSLFQAPDNKALSVLVNIKGVKDGTVMYLRTSSSKDSTVFKKGAAMFTFLKKDRLPNRIQLFSRDYKVKIVTYVDESDLTINGSLGDSTQSCSYSGSKTQNDYLYILKLIDKEQKSADQLQGRRPESELDKDTKSKVQSLYKAIINKEMEFSRQNPSSYMGPELLWGALRFKKVSAKEAKEWFSMFSPEIRKVPKSIEDLDLIENL
jgi:hypothetical protein